MIFGEPPPTATPTPAAPPVGGIAVDPEIEALARETMGASGRDASLLAGAIAGVLLSAIALGAAAWYARRRPVTADTIVR